MSSTADTQAPRDWRESLRPYLKWRIAAMLVLGFASGLPLMMVFSKLSFWLREIGIERSVIGGFYAVSLAYSLKVLWAPLVDRLRLPWLTGRLGQRRSWMMLAVAGTAAGLAIIGLSDPAAGLTLTVAGALLLAYSGATLDISVDAWRIEAAPNDEQANMAAVYILGYRFAIMFAGLGMVIADATSWTTAYLVSAATMVLVACVILLIGEPAHEARNIDADKSFARRMREAVVEPFWQIVARFGRWVVPVLAIVALYRLSDFTMGVMASPFYVDLGYSRATVGWITGLFGPWPVVVGGFLGGFIAVKYRLMPALLVGAVITLVTNGAFAALALAGGPELDAAAAGLAGAEVDTPPVWGLFTVILADNLAAGFVGAVFIAYLSSLTERRFAATQYALFSSAYSLFCKMVASTTSGPLSEMIGWAGFFFVTALFTVPAALLIIWVMRAGPLAAQGIRPDADTEDTDRTS
ncbi:MAG: MFS transporter [Alphaproteobacteria bacterium]|nr:MFS transporter [Alphaproteobacteria bacterium]